ncbi:MAG: ABC transporter permease [Candidatus Aminicenantes bacterium]|nr:ABC transporter permease [Candidatus Aminicenantes bacterium]
MNLAAVIKKEFLQIRRDRLILFMLVFFPTALLLLFGYVLSFDVKNVTLGFLDLDGSDRSRTFIRLLGSGEYFRPEMVFLRQEEIDAALQSGTIEAAIVIPKGFGEEIERGRTARVQGLIDGSDGRKAGIVQGYLQAYATSFGQDLVSDWAARRGWKLLVPVTPEPRIWYNPELKSTPYLIAGLIVFIFMITGTISTSLSVVRERERGTMEQLLVSPLNPAAAVAGKTLPYLGISAASTVIILLAGRLAFGIEIKGSIALLALASLLFLLAALGQGILISTLTNSQQVAYFAAALSSILPALLLSDFVFPISGMPKVIQAVTVIVPAKYYVHLLRGIMMRGAGFAAGAADLAALAIFSTFTLALAAARLKKARLV